MIDNLFYTDLECARCLEGHAENVLWGYGEGLDELCERIGWFVDNNGDVICPDCHCK